MALKYIGIDPNDLNRTRYGEIVLYVEGQPVAFFSSSGDLTISGSIYADNLLDAAQIFNLGFITSSNEGIVQIQNLGFFTESFDGNRPVTQPYLPDLVNYNPGTSTVIDFLEQIFYPDPGFGIDILSNEPFYILETELSGSHVRGTTVAGSPATSYYLQYGSGSFSSNTAVTWSLQTNSVLDINPSTGRLFMKIDLSGSATYQAPSSIAGTVVATSTGGGFATRPFTVTVLDNFAPTIITTDITNYTPKAASFVTASGAYIGSVIINEPGDPAGPPTITSMGGPDAAKFTISQAFQLTDATYYGIYTGQALNSGSYTLEFTGSDVHGQIATASATLEVAANTPPVLSVYSGFNTLLTSVSSGSTYGQITVTDNIGDKIDTFKLTGPDAGDFAVERVSTNMGSLTARGTFISTTGTERWAVKFATAPQVKSYNITASATDNFALASYTGSLAIANAVSASAPGVFVPNGTFYIIESAVSGALVTTATSGIAGTQAQLTTNQPVSWSIDDPTSNLAISGSTIGRLSLVGNLSGSAYQNGNILTADVTAINTSGLVRTQTISVNITDNVPATISVTPVSQNNYNTVSGRTAGFGTVTVADPQSYENVQLIGIGGPAGTSFVTSSESAAQSVVYTISSSVNLNSGSYVVGFTASDAYGQLTYTTQTYTVTPNNPPTVTPSTFSKDITLATSGATIGSVTVSDGDSLEGLASVVLGGADVSKFDLVELSGTTTKTYALNTTQALTGGTYTVSVTATDNFGNVTAQDITITITVNAPAIPTPNGSFYIIESAVSGSSVTTATSGIAGTKAKFTTDQSVTWSLQSGAVLAISQSGELSIKVPMSGSAVYSPGSIIADRVIATNQFSAAEQFDFQVQVTDDLPPVITNTLTGKNNNKTTTATGFGTITISDPQTLGNVSLTDFNGPDVGSFSFTAGTAGSTRIYTVSSSAALNSGSYSFSVTGADAYNQQASSSFTIEVAQNLPPVISLSSFNKNVDEAVSGRVIGTASISDPQDDSIASFVLSGTDSSKFSTTLFSSTATSAVYTVSTTQNLATGSYNLTGSATDSFGLTTATPIPVVVSAVAPAVPIQNAVSFYIIESALSGSNVVVDNTGYTGVQADMNTDQPVTWSIKSPSTYLAIDSNGGLSVKTNISGSVKNASGAPYNLISEYAVATNAYGGSSEALVNVQVTANAAPTLAYTGLTVVSGSASANGQTVGTVTAIDPQSLDSISSIAITGGTDAAKFALALSGSTSYTKTYNINTAQDLTGGSYQIQLTATDSFNKQTVDTKTITVTTPATTKVYVYTSNAFNSTLNTTPTAAEALLYGFGWNGTSYVANLNFLGRQLISGSATLGDPTIAVQSGTATLRQSGSLDSLTNLTTLGKINSSTTPGGAQVMIFFPNDVAALESVPTATFSGSFTGTQGGLFTPTGGNGQHGLISYSNPGSPFAVQSVLHTFTMWSPTDGYTDWGVIMTFDAPTQDAEFSLPKYGDTLPTL